jgi:hypothetical protein
VLSNSAGAGAGLVRSARQPGNFTTHRVEEDMSLIFMCYLSTMLFVANGKKKAAYIAFSLSTVLSILMFAYHTTSSLQLNF